MREVARRLPALGGRPVWIETTGELRVYRGRLRTGPGPGTAVHAASDIRGRRIVIEGELFDNPAELARIVTHEVFHFVWVRLSNATRWRYEGLIEVEIERRSRGELGWSAENRKRALGDDDAMVRSRRWREYVCESFCDTAAWWLAGCPEHDEITLARRYRERRSDWWRNFCGDGRRIAL